METVREIILNILIKLNVSYLEWIRIKDQIEIRYKSESLKSKLKED